MNETLFAISGPGDHPGLTCVASEIKRLERVVSESLIGMTCIPHQSRVGSRRCGNCKGGR